MKKEKLFFEFMPQICRYVNEIIYYNDDFFAKDLGSIITIDAYKDKEIPSPRAEESNYNFWEFLEEKGAIEIINKPKFNRVSNANINLGLLVIKKNKIKITDIDPVKELRDMIEAEKNGQKINNEMKSSEVIFRENIRRLEYKNTTHKFQVKTDLPRFQLFKLLWDGRKVLKKGKVTVDKESLTDAAIAVQIGFAQSAYEYGNNKKAQGKLYAMIKDIRKFLKLKKFPVKIIKEDNYRLIVEN